MSRHDKINIIIAESAPVIAAGLNHCLRRLPGQQCTVTEASSPADLDALMKSLSPEIILVDPNFGGIFDPSQFRTLHPGDYKLVAITTSQLAPSTRQLFDEAISVIDDIPALSDTIRRLIDTEETDDSPRDQLSQREKEVVSLVVKGLTNKEIADKLFLSHHTVMTHRRNIARKLEIHSATGLTIYAIVNHIVDISELNL